jgi:predicted nucleic acid-binding protein
VIVRYYLDAAPVIYSVEEVPPYAAAVDARLSAPDVVRVASDLTRMECRVRPIRDHNDDLLKDFDKYFDETVDEIVGLSRDVIDRATVIRAEYGFKAPDAIHLAAALASGCQVFFTNDHRLDRFEGLTVEIVQP